MAHQSLTANISEEEYNKIGSRREKQRYSYQRSSTSGFIELNSRLEVDAWKVLLEGVRGVDSVGPLPKGSKADQGNDSENHYQAHNFWVSSSVYPSVGMEFELSRHQHSKDTRGKSTITALFKIVGNRAKQLVAWRILRASVAGRELLPKICGRFRNTPARVSGRGDLFCYLFCIGAMLS